MYGVRFLVERHSTAAVRHTPAPVEIAPKDAILRAGRCPHATRTN